MFYFRLMTCFSGPASFKLKLVKIVFLTQKQSEPTETVVYSGPVLSLTSCIVLSLSLLVCYLVGGGPGPLVHTVGGAVAPPFSCQAGPHRPT